MSRLPTKTGRNDLCPCGSGKSRKVLRAVTTLFSIKETARPHALKRGAGFPFKMSQP
ncbi:SEC-C metal-binding domain-containing protein [Geobacillus sp. Y412MC52]|uniref:SEC-C metal-binding domain-containing protein n=1 Tax=Geobacillus sp. (strain Y412MC52) TaxID=550542 RepID=UPI0009B96760